jgi:hypothetical protein
MTDRVMHRVGDSKGRITINATKDTLGDSRVRSDTIRVGMIGGTITSISVDSKIERVENPDQQTPDVLGGDMAVLQAAGEDVGSDFDADEVNRWLALFKFENVSKDDKNKQVERCASRYGATIKDKDCLGGIALGVDSSPHKLKVFYRDSATEGAINEIVMPELRGTYIRKFGNPDPKEKQV